MGLGPPVCTKCMVIGQLSGGTWVCPVCYSVRLGNHLWEFTEEYQKRFEDNTKFMKFVQGKDETGNSE